MESLPLIPKAKSLPNADVSPLIRELFQNELESVLRQNTSKKLSQTILTSLQYGKSHDGDRTSCESARPGPNLTDQRENLLNFSENVLQAYQNHETESESVRLAEKNVFETHAEYFKRQAKLLESKEIEDLYLLKRQPLFKAFDKEHVKKFKLLQGEATLPQQHKVDSDFRVVNFKKWRKRLESLSQDSLLDGFMKREPGPLPPVCLPQGDASPAGKTGRLPRCDCTRQQSRPKKAKSKGKETEIFRAEPNIVFFTDYKPGEVYAVDIEVKNTYTKGLQFQLKPMSPDGPFHVSLKSEVNGTKLYPGLSFQLTVEFSPKSLDVVAEDIYIAIEDGKKLLIPLMAYLEPPILKTHREINEFTKATVEKIASSCIECGACFTGDTKVTKIRFRCYRGSGEFFVMSSENWNRSYVNSVTYDNMLEIPPFRVYPVHFKISKGEIIDLLVEFSPKNSGTHVDNIVIACDNGEIRCLDLLGDAVGWHSYYFSFQDDLQKVLPVDSDDDYKVKYYINFYDTTPCGKVEKTFSIANNSNMSFEYQWKIREATISNRQDKYLKLSKYQVKIEPENGIVTANSINEFTVTITFQGAEEGDYRMVLSLYVLNLPYQSIEEDNTIIQPTGLVRNLYSQSLYGEEEFTTSSPELMSLQGTYESLQESIRSYVECQNKAQANVKYDICRTTCLPNPGICAKPLKKSKTYFNIGESIEDDGITCGCRGKPAEGESNSDSCSSEKPNETAVSKSEVVWDYVDILVDEIELWVEVGTVKLHVEPAIIRLPDSFSVGDPPVVREVFLTNLSKTNVRCKWILPRIDDDAVVSVNAILSAREGSPETSTDTPKSQSGHKEICRTGSTGTRQQTCDEDDSVTDTNNSTCGELSSTEGCERENEFTLSGFETIRCVISTSALRPGKVRETIKVRADQGAFDLDVLIMGTASAKYFTISTSLLKYKAVKSGTRTSQHYTIENKYSGKLQMRVSQFDLDYSIEHFYPVSQEFTETEFSIDEKAVSRQMHYVNTKVPGLKCSLLEIGAKNHSYVLDQFILMLAVVKDPNMSLTTARFQNGILSPPRMMYVGHKVRTSVTLKNLKKLNTTFAWGNPFGCHCRKIKVEISPAKGEVPVMGNLQLDVVLTPLDAGIISHCYVPCFISRRSVPIILSIVGIVDNLNVTFEIIESSPTRDVPVKRTIPEMYKTLYRVPWPERPNDPLLGKRFISQSDLLMMKCHCSEVENQAGKSEGGEAVPEGSARVGETALETIPRDDIDNPSRSTRFVGHKKSPCTKEFETEAEICLVDTSDSLQKYAPMPEPEAENLSPANAELQFYNVTYDTCITRQFVIRNETPVETKFHIKVQNFGETKTENENRILSIRDKVLRPSKSAKQTTAPLVLSVDPCEGVLLGHAAVCINVTASGNTWGEYRDQIVCQVTGIHTYNLKVFVQMVGHPFYFPMFENYPMAKPVLRFQPLSVLSQPVTKKLRVVNRSAIPITISWIIFFTQAQPKEEENEESLTFGLDSNANLDSIHSEDSTKSVKVYLPKNISESTTTFRNMLDMKDFSQNSGSFGKMDTFSEKNESHELIESEKTRQDSVVQSPSEDVKSESQHFLFRIDLHNFQVDPKEISLLPFGEDHIVVTFDPRLCKTKVPSQEFRAVLTGCIKLSPSDESRLDLLYRPCGMNFLSEVLDFNAVIENPLVSFEILKGDLKFYVEANAVISSPSKRITISRTFLIKNKSQKAISLKIEISPGTLFSVSRVETLDRLYLKYDPEEHELNVDAGRSLELDVNCSVAYKDVMYAFERFKQVNRKDGGNRALSADLKMSNTEKSTEDGDNLEVSGPPRQQHSQDREPWYHYFNSVQTARVPTTAGGNSSLEHRDSLKINLNRMSSEKSDHSICDDYIMCLYAEGEGECYQTPSVDETPVKPKLIQNFTLIQEEINFVQSDLVTQTLTAELHLCFPAIRINPKSLDMGNTYIGETSVRYCSLINLRGTPTDFKIKSKSNVGEFTAKPITGTLPPTNYNSDIGETITVTFSPEQPGYLLETFQVFCNLEMEFDLYELTVSGIGTWNEKYKKVKRVETGTKLHGVSPN